MASLRVRLSALVAVASFVVLAGAGWAVVVVVQDWLHDAVRDEARRAVGKAQIDARVGLPVGPGTDRPGQVDVRVIRDGGPGGGPPGAAPPDDLGIDPGDVEEGEVVVTRRTFDGIDSYVAVAADRDAEGNRFVLFSVAPLDEAERTIGALRRATLVAVPTLGLLLAGLAALVAGRVLRPVAVMRAEADDISHGTLHRRLTPATRSSELAALAATMNDMLDRLERSATGQRQLVSDVSHELRSPLATIRAELELAGDDADTAVALAEVDRLEDVVEGLLALSRLDEGGAGHPEDLDLEDVVAAQVAAVARPGIEIDASAVAPARLHADRRAVVGLVRNLLDNAVRHAAATVRVTVAEHDGRVELAVEDDGPGIPPEHRQRVFARFTRLDEGRSRDAGGAGLGLAVAAAAVRAQGGTIAVEDGAAGGARLHVVLPARPVRPPP